MIKKSILTIIGTVVLVTIMSFTKKSQTECPIDPWIKEHYTIDAQLMFMESGAMTDIQSSDSVLVPVAETNSYLHLLSAINKVNDTIFKKLKIKHHYDRKTFVIIDLDVSKPWVKTFVGTNGKTINNKSFRNLLMKYGLGIDKVHKDYIYCYSKKIINQYPALHNELTKISGLKGIGNSVSEGKLPTIKYDKKTHIITLRQYMKGVVYYSDGEEKILHEWKYEILNCEAKLISTK